MRRIIIIAALAASVAGCGGGGGGSGGGFASTTAPVTTAAPAPGPTPAQAIAPVVSAYEARRAAYLAHSATGGSSYSQLARLELGQPFVRAEVDRLCDFMDARKDTADFKATALLRLVYLHGTNPAIPQDLRDRARRTLLGFRYWIDEPNPDEQVFWSENHYLMYAAAEYLAGQLYPTEVFGNSGLTGAQHRAKALPRLARWLRERARHGYSEWCSPVYYPHDVSPLLNLIDFAQDAEVATRASIALDLLLFDLARLTHKGSFGLTAGRVYEEHKLSGRGQSIADLIEVLWGTRGGWADRGSTGATPFVTSRRYRVPHVLLAIGLDEGRDRVVERARVGVSFAQAAAEGIGFTDLEDGLFWWRQGGYMAPEAIGLSRRMIEAWGLWDHETFSVLKPLRSLPEPLLVAASQALGPASRGSLLGGANLYAFQTPDAQLSSAIDYQAGRLGVQQHAWQATLDLDAAVFTTAPGNLGLQGGVTRWTGSTSLPLISQHEDVALILYNPPTAWRVVFPRETHALFPRAAFDEVVEQGRWVFGRKGKGYVALWSALPTYWTSHGPDAGRELVAPGARNAWVCEVGREAEDGPFAAFVQRVSGTPVTFVGPGDGPQTDPLSVEVGGLRLAWGQRVLAADFPRLDGPYATQAWGDPRLEVRHAGLSLTHDGVAGTRTGDGL